MDGRRMLCWLQGLPAFPLLFLTLNLNPQPLSAPLAVSRTLSRDQLHLLLGRLPLLGALDLTGCPLSPLDVSWLQRAFTWVDISCGKEAAVAAPSGVSCQFVHPHLEDED